MVDLGDQGAGQGPAEDVDEPPPEQPVEQRSLVVPSVATACQDSSRLVRPFWAREAVGLVRLGEPFPSVFLEEDYRGRYLYFLEGHM